MININYIGSIVRILETPFLKFTKNKIPFTKFRAQLPQIRKKQSDSIITVNISGYLANDIVKYYGINDYILIEGYISLRKSKTSQAKNKSNCIQINARKIFPLFLNN